MSIKNFLLKFIKKEAYQELKNQERIKNDKNIFEKKYKNIIDNVHKKIINKKSLNFFTIHRLISFFYNFVAFYFFRANIK